MKIPNPDPNLVKKSGHSESDSAAPSTRNCVLRESLLQARSGLEGHTHCNENPIYVFPEKELRGLIPNFHFHVSVNDLYIPRIGPHIFLQQNKQTVPLLMLYIPILGNPALQCGSNINHRCDVNYPVI
jgi:hypothetical protein